MKTSNPILSRRGYSRDDGHPGPGLRQPQPVVAASGAHSANDHPGNPGSAYGDPRLATGVVVQAVLGTLAVSAGVLIAYRMRWIRVTRRFQGFVLASAAGFVLLMAADLLFSAFGGGNGLGFDSGGLGVVFGVVGILLGACFLALDFKQVENAIVNGAPREESWMAAFGLTLTLVWIYLEALRVLSLLRGDER
ncbi:Bax inhibitor-1/YccA family protein [Nonomuraea sp. NPDC005983]|uniref:Bax inhibitor-1/YccA family protein n=1 Tax=Nonomuraea sp. NPDC005983 TaxID=3155595 RepID=UPI0033B42EBE